jgi:hypothetical protein
MDLTAIFYHVDNFCNQFDKWLINRLLMLPRIKGQVRNTLTESEIMSIIIYYAACSDEYKHFKAFYAAKYTDLKAAFPHLVSYERMIELKESVELRLVTFLISLFSECTGVSFIDSTKIEACRPKRAKRHKTLKGLAQWGMTSDGWFYGFKLHAVVNHLREIVSLCITPGNVADNNEHIIRKMTDNVFGKMFGDKGYILNPELWSEVYYHGIQFITNIRKNMQQKLIPIEDKMILNKRASIIETFFSILKDRMSLQYTRVRSVYGFVCNVISMLIAYQMKVTKKGEVPPTVSNQSTLAKNAVVAAC